MADSEVNFCRLVNEFGSIRERRKLPVNVCMSKAIWCSRHVNVGRMDVRLNGKPPEEVDRFKKFRLPVEADGGCEMDVVHRINEQYKAWVALYCKCAEHW